MAPKAEDRYPNYLWLIAAVFFLLALSFIFDLWPRGRDVIKYPPVDPKYFSTQTVRQPMHEPILKKDGDLYRCNDCHQNIVPSPIQKSFFSAHENIILQHGINNYCLTCHSLNNREFLVDIHGEDIPFSKSELLCQKCHGTIYRDWEKGAHGRINSFWDKSKGEKVKATCVACHDPHQPKFKPLEPSPAPRVRNYRDFLENLVLREK